MATWQVATVLLCLYGFFKEMKPSEPFLTPYLNSTYKHFSLEELSSEVYPFWTYSYLVALIFVFLLTDVLRYKPFIILEGFAYAGTRILLIWGSTILAMQFMQLCYGIASATEVAYFSYVYCVVPTEKYQTVTSYTRAIVLFGRASSGLLGQLLISTQTTDYLQLNYISTASVAVAVLISWFLPAIETSVFQNPISEAEGDNSATGNAEGEEATSSSPSVMAPVPTQRGRFPVREIFKLCKSLYFNRTIFVWSVWWALTMCGYLQVSNYVQNLWGEIADEDGKNDEVWNGAVEAFGTLAGAAVAFAISFAKLDSVTTLSETLLGFIAIVNAGILVVMATTNTMWLAYVTYIVYRAAYALMITLASFYVASQIKTHCFALVFGWNTFIALILQTILTMVVADKHGLELSIRKQFIVYGAYHGLIAVIFLARPCWLLLMKMKVQCCAKIVSSSNASDESRHPYTQVI